MQKNYICGQNNLHPLLRFSFILLLGIFAAFKGMAQPCFSASGLNTTGCVPFTVQMVNCSNGVNISYSYLGNPMKSLTTATSFTYTAAGIYTVTQYGTYGGSGDSLRKTNYIKVYEIPRPGFVLKGCNGKKVRVFPSGPYQQYSIGYGDGSSPEVVSSSNYGEHTYPDLSTRIITISGIYVPGNCGTSTTVSFTPSPDLVKPVLKKLSVNNNTTTTADMTLTFDALPYIRYILKYRTSASTAYTTAGAVLNTNGEASFIFKNLNSFQTNYCFKVVASDTCGGNDKESDEICNINLSAIAENEKNKLLWSTIPLDSLVSFSLSVNGSALVGYTNANFVTQYTHTNLICNQQYCYQSVAVYKPNNFLSMSDTVCIKAVSSTVPPSVTNLFSTVTANFVQLNWSFPGTLASKKVFIEHSSDNSTFVKMDSMSFRSYVDKSADITGLRNFYRLAYIDSCGNLSTYSNTTSPVRLIQSKAFSSIVSLSWTDYLGYSVKEYVLQKRDEGGNVYFTYQAGKSKSYSETPQDTISQKFYFRIMTVPNNSNDSVSFSNEIEYTLQPKLLVPNAFTPNGDGLNDTFLPKTLFVSSFAMTVYNKWGEAVFHTNDQTHGWDGAKGGQECPVGVYAYTIEASDVLGNKLASRGTVSLLK